MQETTVIWLGCNYWICWWADGSGLTLASPFWLATSLKLMLMNWRWETTTAGCWFEECLPECSSSRLQEVGAGQGTTSSPHWISLCSHSQSHIAIECKWGRCSWRTNSVRIKGRKVERLTTWACTTQSKIHIISVSREITYQLSCWILWRWDSGRTLCNHWLC